MLSRHTIAKSLLPLLALGALTFGARTASSEEMGAKVAAIAPRSRTLLPRPTPPTTTVEKPAPAESPARRDQPADGTWGQVNAANVNVRTGPGIKNAIITTMRGGDFVKPTGVQGSWMEIEWPRGVPAWVPKSAVAVKSDSSAAAKSETVVRGQASRQATVIGKFAAGTAVNVLGESGDWYKITAPDSARAYISARYVLTGVKRPVQAEPTPKAAAVLKTLPSSEPATEKTKAVASAATSEALAATVEETRRKLAEPQKTEFTTPRDISITQAAKELDEQLEAAKLENEKLAAENERLAVSKRESEMKEQARIEEQQRAVALAREEEARRKAEAEEVAREDEQKRIAAAEAVRLAEELKKKNEPVTPPPTVEVTSKPVPQPVLVPETRTGVFVAAAEPKEPALPAAPLADRLPEPAASVKVLPKATNVPVTAPILVSQPKQSIVIETEEPAATSVSTEPQPEPVLKLRSKFVLPTREPRRPVRAEVIDDLPEPTGAAPASHRLQPQHKTQACDTGSGQVVTADGTIQQAPASSVSGATYALVRDGQTVHLLTAGDSVNLDSFAGRRVTVTGTLLQSVSANDSVLRVGSIAPEE